MYALVSNGDEGRSKLRKAMGSCKRALIHGSPNGVTPGASLILLTQEAIPGEVKHLSNQRKRKRSDSVSSGERTRNSPNHRIFGGVIGPR